MIDLELQDRVNDALDEIDVRLKNWNSIKAELNMKLDDEWDFEEYEQHAAIEAALDQLTAIQSILQGGDYRSHGKGKFAEAQKKLADALQGVKDSIKEA